MRRDGVIALGQDGKVVAHAVQVVTVSAADEKYVLLLPQLGFAPLHVVRDVQEDDVLVLLVEVLHRVVEVVLILNV